MEMEKGTKNQRVKRAVIDLRFRAADVERVLAVQPLELCDLEWAEKENKRIRHGAEMLMRIKGLR